MGVAIVGRYPRDSGRQASGDHSRGGVAEMGTQGQTGCLVEVGDVGGLAEALLGLLRDSRLRRRMGEAGREFALENYHADAVAGCT